MILYIVTISAFSAIAGMLLICLHAIFEDISCTLLNTKFILRIGNFLAIGGTFLIILSGFIIGVLDGKWYAIVAVTVFMVFAYMKIKDDGISMTIYDMKNWFSQFTFKE